GSLLISGMNSSCTRRAASLEFVTPSYLRTVKYALMLIILCACDLCFMLFAPVVVAKLVDRLPIPGLFQRPASTSRVVRHGNVHRRPTGKIWKGYMGRPGFLVLSRPRPSSPGLEYR